MAQQGRGRFTAVLTGILLIGASWSAAEAPQAGDARRGEALYAGTASFEKGGAPCLGCHGLAGAGLGKGGAASYGPDLTDMYSNFGEEGIAAILDALPFPSMEALYAGKPLSAGEKVDLSAFFREIDGREAPPATGSLLAEAGAGLGVLFLIVGLLGKRRLSSRESLELRSRQDGRNS